MVPLIVDSNMECVTVHDSSHYGSAKRATPEDLQAQTLALSDEEQFSAVINMWVSRMSDYEPKSYRMTYTRRWTYFFIAFCI